MLLQKRPATGIWASLWSLPEAADHETARAWFAKHLQGDYDHAEALTPIAHAFTHYHVQLQPLHWRGLGLRAALRDDDELRWVALDELASLGIPAPVRKLLLAVIPAKAGIQ